MQRRYKATMPGSETKTHRDYFWLLPDEVVDFVPHIMAHPDTGFHNFSALNKALGPFYDKQILADSGVRISDKRGKRYTMRTIRAAKATEWILLQQEYEVMKWKPRPPNPLQHTSLRMTIEKYAIKQSDNQWEAKRRCVEKYGGDPTLRQEWMNEWLNMREANKINNK